MLMNKPFLVSEPLIGDGKLCTHPTPNHISGDQFAGPRSAAGPRPSDKFERIMGDIIAGLNSQSGENEC